MTESDWPTSVDPLAMIELLQQPRPAFRTRWLGWITKPAVTVSERKWRLFYCAIAQRIAHLISTPAARKLIEVVERLADGRASRQEYAHAVKVSVDNRHLPFFSGLRSARPLCDLMAARVIENFHRYQEGRCPMALYPAAQCLALAEWYDQLATAGRPEVDAVVQLHATTATAHQADLLREILGDPFHTHTVDPTWLAWNGGTVKRLAEGIYRRKLWDELPILADALEDAGCEEAALLEHCRQGGPHALGCWTLDLLLGKQ